MTRTAVTVRRARNSPLDLRLAGSPREAKHLFSFATEKDSLTDIRCNFFLGGLPSKGFLLFMWREFLGLARSRMRIKRRLLLAV